MHPQLQAIADEFELASQRLRALEAMQPDELWPVRAEPGHWSISECILHLNLTSRAFLPPLRLALAKARSTGEPAPRRYRLDPLGWLVWRAQSPRARLRFRTPPAFEPADLPPPAEIRASFEQLQSEQLACVHEADGLALQGVKMASPFDPRVHYNLFAALSILPRHQHRHLRQAERVTEARAGSAGR